MDIRVNANDIMMALGYKDTSANEFVLEQAELVAGKANSISAPCKTHMVVKIAEVSGNDVVLETGDVFTCKSLAKEVRDCSHLIVAVATIGHDVDREIKKGV